MVMRGLVAASLALVPMESQVYSIPADPRIVLVDCDNSRGSAFRVGPHNYVSVAHVTDDKGCKINGQPFKVEFAFITTSEDRPGFMRIDCGGFKLGHRYLGLGYARGRPNITAVEIVGTGEKVAGLAWLVGLATVIPGQSGGPVVDRETMRPVGTVNRYNAMVGASGSVALADTALCKKS